MVRIVTDSAADIPPRLQKNLDIPVVPARILFGRETYKPGVDLDTSKFYDLLRTHYFHPISTQASPLDFYRIFNKLKYLKEDIIYVGLDKSLSALALSAELAISRLPEMTIDIFECGGPSGFQGIMVIQASRMAMAGFSKDEILLQLERLNLVTIQYAAAETLEYLVRGGRVSTSKGTLGTLLGINPLLKITNTGVHEAPRAFGMEQAIEKIAIALKSYFTPDQPVLALTNHAVNVSGAASLSELIKKNFNVVESYLSSIGPTIGSHIGPGAVGVALSPALSFMT